MSKEGLIDILKLRAYYKNDAVFITEHAAQRCRQRGIKAKDIRSVVENGEIIEQYPEDYPFPSCLILGEDALGRSLHVCMSDEGTASRIITAYCPDKNRWRDNLKERKETT